MAEQFLHVFAPLVFFQGSFLFEGFLTLRARMPFLIPELAVNEVQVPQQVGMLGEGLATLGAQVRSLFRVDSLVVNEICIASEPAAAHSTLEWQVTRVRPLVQDEEAEPGEGFQAVVAFEWSAHFMDILTVSEEGQKDSEGLLTAGALKRGVWDLMSR